MALIDVVPWPSTSPQPPETPPSRPLLRAREQVHTLNTGQFKELLKAIEAIRTTPASEGNTLVSTKDELSAKNQPISRASKLEFKEVNEL